MKRLWLILLGLLAFTPAFSQLAHNEWRIGVSGGFSTYYGDLSPYPINDLGDFGLFLKLFKYNKHYTDQLSGQLSLEKRITPTTGWMLHFGQYQFSMSDRYVMQNGTLKTNTPHFERALNFQTDLNDVGLSLVFKSDNGHFLNENAFLAPYVSIGAGFLWFDVKGDLLDDEGFPYDNSSQEIIHNGRYETSLAPLRTEREDGYSRHGFYGQIGLGFRLKLSHRLELFVQSDFRHAFTDYLDDVSGQYRENYDSEFQEYAAHPGTNTINPESPWRGDSNGKNDWYIYHGAGLKFSFGATNKGFSAPKVSSRYNHLPEQAQGELTPADTLHQDTSTDEKTSPITQNYYTYLHWDNGKKWEQLESQISNLELEVKILERQRQLDSISSKIDSTRFMLRQYDLSLQKTEKDTLLSTDEKNASIDQFQTLRQKGQSNLDSLNWHSGKIQDAIDSLQNQKRPIASFKENTGLDSMAFINELRQVPQKIQYALQEKHNIPSSNSTTPDTGMLYGNDLRDTLAQAQSLKTDKIESHYMEWLQELQKSRQADQARMDSLLRAITESGKSTPNQEIQEVDTPEAAPVQTQAKGRRPILLWRGDRRTEKVPQQGSTPNQPLPAEEAAITQQGISIGESKPSSEAISIAIALGMQRLGLNLAEMDTLQKSTDSENEWDFGNEIYPTSPPSPTPIADTVYLEKSGELKLISSKTEVYFENNQTEPTDTEVAKLSPLVDYVRENPGYLLHLTGYADNTGSLGYNLQLIERRVEQVRQILLDRWNVPAEKISIAIGGQIRRGSQYSSKEKDRRVEVKIIPSNGPTSP